jgi:hypothetical protein
MVGSRRLACARPSYLECSGNRSIDEDGGCREYSVFVGLTCLYEGRGGGEKSLHLWGFPLSTNHFIFLHPPFARVNEPRAPVASEVVTLSLPALL